MESVTSLPPHYSHAHLTALQHLESFNFELNNDFDIFNNALILGFGTLSSDSGKLSEKCVQKEPKP